MSAAPDPIALAHLVRLAQKLRASEHYLSKVLFIYQQQEGLSEKALAQRLSLSVAQLPRLALCERPRSQAEKFLDQIKQIAAYTGADPVALAQIIRQVEVIETLQHLPLSTQTELVEPPRPFRSGLLAAANDREEEDQPPDFTAEPNDKPQSAAHD